MNAIPMFVLSNRKMNMHTIKSVLIAAHIRFHFADAKLAPYCIMPNGYVFVLATRNSSPEVARKVTY
jgi:hypothetical protein